VCEPGSTHPLCPPLPPPPPPPPDHLVSASTPSRPPPLPCLHFTTPLLPYDPRSVLSPRYSPLLPYDPVTTLRPPGYPTTPQESACTASTATSRRSHTAPRPPWPRSAARAVAVATSAARACRRAPARFERRLAVAVAAAAALPAQRMYIRRTLAPRTAAQGRAEGELRSPPQRSRAQCRSTARGLPGAHRMLGFRCDREGAGASLRSRRVCVGHARGFSMPPCARF
jgi:hypothetical protein